MLEALMLRPESFGPAWFERMREAGHDRVGMEDAVAVGAMFACILRVADCLGLEQGSPRSLAMAARHLLSDGYAKTAAERRGDRRFADAWARVRAGVCTTPGYAELELRARVFAWIERDARSADADLAELPSALQGLIRTASRTAYKVSDEHLAALLGQGWDPRALFELVVTIGAAAGSTRYAIAMDALEGLR